MAGWIWQAGKRGILTTKYPTELPTAEETPVTAHAPTADAKASPDFVRGREICPTQAINEGGIAQGSCIRCARCPAAGFTLQGPPDLVTIGPGPLVWPAGRPPEAKGGSTPLEGFGRSLHVLLADVGSCNACNLEVLALGNPYYDSQRLGIFFTNSPRHADVLLVVGIPTEELIEPLRRAYEAMPSPKSVMAVGACALDGGIFRNNAGTLAPLRGKLPVDVFVPGCPPAPVAILAGLLRTSGRQVPRERGR